MITSNLLDIYAYVLKPGGTIYNVTDVKQLHEWTLQQFKNHPLFKIWNQTQMVCNVLFACFFDDFRHTSLCH